MKFNYYALKLCGFFVVVFLAQLLFPSITEMFVLNEAAWTEVWRFVSALFLHANIGHLLYNGFALALFGSILERLTSGRRFLYVFFISGIAANLISIFFYPSSLGASGAIFGVIGALIIVRPTLVVWAFGLPMPLFIAGLIWAAGDFIGAVGYLSGNPLDKTGNIAHLSGMFFGLIFGAFYRNWNQTREKRKTLRLDEGMMEEWENFYMR